MSECTHDCSTCGVDCSSRAPESMIEKPNEFSKIKKVIAVVSGKGGVGKSAVTSMLSVIMQRRGYNAAILDADVTGPSIPRAFGINERATASDIGIFPARSKLGTQIMSVNLLLEDPSDPVVWRGPVIAGMVSQFWKDVIWKDVDFMFIDMPPGTGDVPLTVFQSLPVDGIIVVTSPQELVSMIVEKAVKMAGLLNVPVLGIVENMSYFTCPNCGEKHSVFGESHIEELAEKYNIPNISKLPVNIKISAACDKGMIELFEGDWLDNMADYIEKL